MSSAGCSCPSQCDGDRKAEAGLSPSQGEHRSVELPVRDFLSAQYILFSQATGPLGQEHPADDIVHVDEVSPSISPADDQVQAGPKQPPKMAGYSVRIGGVVRPEHNGRADCYLGQSTL